MLKLPIKQPSSPQRLLVWVLGPWLVQQWKLEGCDAAQGLSWRW